MKEDAGSYYSMAFPPDWMQTILKAESVLLFGGSEAIQATAGNDYNYKPRHSG